VTNPISISSVYKGYMEFTETCCCAVGSMQEVCHQTADDSHTHRSIASGTAEVAGNSRASVSIAREISLHCIIKVNYAFPCLYARKGLFSWADDQRERGLLKNMFACLLYVYSLYFEIYFGGLHIYLAAHCRIVA
jgi:hypothetical protein